MNSLFKKIITAAHINNCALERESFFCFQHQFLFYSIPTLSIVIITFMAYQPSLFNFLLMDDFGFLIWLKQAINNPSLLMQTFFHHYMNEMYYYRPLITLIWAIECFFLGTNGLYFRLCSIVCMLLSSLIVGLIIFEFSKADSQSAHKFKIQITWAFLGAALFAFYPLHVPAVNWFAAQHTLLVSLIYLLGFWLYLRWRSTSAKLFSILSVGCFSLALLTEEMAATLPITLIIYELLCINRGFITTKWLKLIKSAVLATYPYLIVLTVYFFLRKIILGTFTTQFSGFVHQRPIEMCQTWLHGLRQILVPIDFFSMSKNSPISILWQIIIFLLLVLSAWSFITPKVVLNNKRLGVFLIIWFFLSLAPSNNIFLFDVPHLLNARVTYLATIPLCVFLTCGIANFSYGVQYSPLARTLGSTLLILSILLLYYNNYIFSKFGHETNKIIEELQKYYSSVPDDPQVKILALPMLHTTHINCMVKSPFLKRDIFNCSSLTASDQSVPFGCLRGPKNTNEWKMVFLYWDDKKKQLKPTLPYGAIPTSMNFPVSDYKKFWQGNDLRTIIQNGTSSPAKIIWEGENILHLNSNKISFLDIDLEGFPCWPINFINFKVKIAPLVGKDASRLYELNFSNNIVQDWSSKEYPLQNKSSLVRIIPNGKAQDLIFPLRGLPHWALGGKCSKLRLFLPPYTDMELISISLPEADTIIPIVSGSTLIELSQSCNERFIDYNASHIKKCTQAALEIIGPSKDFETLYSYESEKGTIFNIPTSTASGRLKLFRKSFPGKGIYKARIRALDENSQQVGLCGDHFLISVE